MKYKIIVDSSSNLYSSYLDSEKEIDFSVVPLIIRVNEEEFIDDDNVDTKKILDLLNKNKTSIAKTSCPTTDSFLNEISGADKYIIITISSKLSSSFNNAVTAVKMKEEENNAIIIDSKLVAGSMELLVMKAKELIKENKEFEIIKEELNKYRDSLKLLFVLNKFDNLVKNGRMNKITAFIANLVNIKPLCYGEDGEIKIKEKIRTIEGAFKRLVFNIGRMCDDIENRICIISYTDDLSVAENLKLIINKNYSFKEVKIVKNKALCSVYALEGGIICSF